MNDNYNITQKLALCFLASSAAIGATVLAAVLSGKWPNDKKKGREL